LAKTNLKGSSFRDLLRMVFSRKSVILSAFIGVTVLVLVVSLITPPKYEAAAKIMARERKIESPPQSGFFYDYQTERVAFLQSQMEIIQSDEVARRVLARLQPTPQAPIAKQIEAFEESIKISSPKGYGLNSSDILLIQVTDTDPARVAQKANLLTDEYIDYAVELKGRTAKQTAAFLERQSQAQLEKLKQAEEGIKNFEEKSGPESAFLMAAVKAREGHTELITLNNNYLNARVSLAETESYLKQLHTLVRRGVIPPRMVRENPVLATIKNTIVKLEGQLSSLRSQFTDLYPKNIMVMKEIDRNRQLFDREMNADLEGRVVDIVALEARVKALKQTVNRYTALAQSQLDYSRMIKNYEVLEEGYQNLLRDIEQARLAEAMDTYQLANIEIIDRAEAPKNPVSPDIFFNTLMGATVGILLGFGLAFVFYYFDHTVKSVEDVEQYLQLPVLGTIPRR
jgi:uncharacterized protein involved in exopolysaccharide biosynthesis